MRVGLGSAPRLSSYVIIWYYTTIAAITFCTRRPRCFYESAILLRIPWLGSCAIPFVILLLVAWYSAWGPEQAKYSSRSESFLLGLG